MKNKFLFIILLVMSVGQTLWAAEPNVIDQIRVWPAPEKTRVVFDVAKKPEYKLLYLSNPDRLVIDIQNTLTDKDHSRKNLSDPNIKNIRIGKHPEQKLRIVFDLKKKLDYDVFSLPPEGTHGHRLVVDLMISEKAAILALFAQDDFDDFPIFETKPKIKVKSKRKSKKKFIVAIDPGHGGEDPGAIGKKGTKEKHVVLSVAKHLKRYIDAQPNMRGVLIRKGDYYVSLQNRVRYARKAKADLFISIHADAAPNKKAYGASVYTVSNRGASSTAAKWLASRENRSDLVGGVSLKKRRSDVASVLLDMTQTITRNESGVLSFEIIQSLKKITKMHKTNTESAGFAVLKAPDIPSILVETGFISNPKGERELKNARHQKKIAKAICDGVRRYRAKTRVY